MPADPLELAAIEMVRVRLPMRRSRAAAHGTMPAERDVVLVRALGSDGAEGWGECSALEAPTYGDEHTDGAWAVLRDIVVPTALAGGRNRGIGHPMASASVDVAVTDLSLRRQGLTLPGALGRDDAEGLALAWTGVVGMQSSIDDVLAEVDEAVDRGAAAVKLKICPGWDVEPVTAVHDAHPQLRISVDANGSFGREHTEHLVELGRLLAECGGYLEQPLAAEDLSGLTRLASRSRARVALDETVVSATDAGILGSLRDRGLINVKPARLGGVSSTLALAQVVASIKAKRRPQTYLGGMFETGVGRSAALAIGQVSVTLAETDLGPSAVVLRGGRDRSRGARRRRVAPRDLAARSQPGAAARAAGRGGRRPPHARAVSAPVRLEAHASGHWQVERWWGSAAGLHGLDWPEPLSPTVWLMEVDHPTLVLGSTQRPDAVDADALGRAGIDVAVRRSGGGAVLVEPDGSVWIDVLIPRERSAVGRRREPVVRMAGRILEAGAGRPRAGCDRPRRSARLRRVRASGLLRRRRIGRGHRGRREGGGALAAPHPGGGPVAGHLLPKVAARAPRRPRPRPRPPASGGHRGPARPPHRGRPPRPPPLTGDHIQVHGRRRSETLGR